jgi:hypothetical protein
MIMPFFDSPVIFFLLALFTIFLGNTFQPDRIGNGQDAVAAQENKHRLGKFGFFRRRQKQDGAKNLKHRGASPDAFAAIFGGVSWFCRSGVSSFLVIERGRVGKNSSGTFTQVAPTEFRSCTREHYIFSRGKGQLGFY